jgi:hypothetical protein
VVVDGAAVRSPPRWTAILARTLRFTGDGAHLAYAAEDAAGAHVVIDGAAGPAWSGIGQLALDDTGAHVAYAARGGRDRFAVIDGVVGPRFDDIAQLTVAPHGGRAAYVGVDGAAMHVVVDGEVDHAPGPDAGRVRALQLSRDGAHVAYVASRDSGDRVICDGAEVALVPPGSLDPGSLGFVAAPGCGLAYRLVEPTGARVVRAGAAGPRFDDVGPLSISSDGAHLGYAARRGAAWLVVLDGVEHDAGRWAEAPVWSADGRRAGYLSRRGDKAIAVVDDRAYTFDTVLEGTLAFSRDGRAWAVIAGDLAREELFFAVDGVHRVSLDTAELYSAAAALSRVYSLLEPAPNVLAAWSAAEADRARGDSPASGQTANTSAGSSD